MMVTVKPMQLTIVRAVPFKEGDALCAIGVENKGESAMTTMPQPIKNSRKIPGEFCFKNRGDSRQQLQESSNAVKAMFLV